MTCLDTILAPGGLSVLFQPIMDVRAEHPGLWAIESLVRGPRGSTIETAPVLFEYVRRKRAEPLVDRACVTAVFEAIEGLPASLRFSINVHAMTLSRDPAFLSFLSEAAHARSISPSRIIVEIVEHAPEWADPGLADDLDVLRGMGVRIALDDIGLGQSNYRMILNCKPDYFKIDRYFVAGSHKDPYRQAVLDSVSHLARRFGACTIAEGVEDVADLDTVRSLGIGLAQGHLFSAPVAPALVRRFAHEQVPAPPDPRPSCELLARGCGGGVDPEASHPPLPDRGRAAEAARVPAHHLDRERPAGTRPEDGGRGTSL